MAESSSPTIRQGLSHDLPDVVRLVEAKRTAYERYQPRFWRKAHNSAELSLDFFSTLHMEPDVLFLVAETADKIVGFLIAKRVPVPPVYNPGGPAALIDDFCVEQDSAWDSAGRALLEAAYAALKSQGIAQVVVICGDHDVPKKVVLAQTNLSIASTWWTKSL